MAHPLMQGTKRVAVFTDATPTDGGNQVGDTNPLPVKISDGTNEVSINDNLLDKRFRAGSLLIDGSIGNWNLKVIEKNCK